MLELDGIVAIAQQVVSWRPTRRMMRTRYKRRTGVTRTPTTIRWPAREPAAHRAKLARRLNRP